jgi:hypothetical protein
MNEPRLSPAQILDLRSNAPKLGALADRTRRAFYGHRAALVAEASAQPIIDFRVNADTLGAAQEKRGPLFLRVPLDPSAVARYVDFLAQVAESNQIGAVIPFCDEPAATHKIWLLGAARLMLPAHWHVAAHHEALTIRVAQIALAFGTDIICGPIVADRVLPLAGVTRPNENSKAGLSALFTQAGQNATFYRSFADFFAPEREMSPEVSS